MQASLCVEVARRECVLKMTEASVFAGVLHAIGILFAIAAIWTANFLASSIFMRAAAGQRRLYITTREGYLQHSEGETQSWTWKSIRELPCETEDTDTLIINHSAEEQFQEDCWNHRPELDTPISAYSSFNSQVSAEALRAQPAQTALQVVNVLYSKRAVRAPARRSSALASNTPPRQPPGHQQ